MSELPPAPLHGVHIHLVAPSGYAPDPVVMTRGVARLRTAGCEVSGLQVLGRSDLRFAGSDAERAADINGLATLPELPDLVLAMRGGYGATRLLPQLNYAALRERLAGTSTALVGHSDFTALQLALHARSGLCTFSGPLLADLGAEPLDEPTWRQLWATLTAPEMTVAWATTAGREIDVRGPLWGGNLAVLCSLLGTPYFPAIEDGILFVEELGEPPFRIERWLYQLQLAGVLGRQQALVLGTFEHCRPGPRDHGYDLAAAFAQIGRVAGIPLVDGLPHGHAGRQLTLPFGAPARLRVAGGRAQLECSGYPHLARAAPEPPPGP
jgi:muramoyltetrapeptide carboxypeptidase